MANVIETVASLASELGLRTTAPTMLRDGSNVLLHLAPAPVVARIAGLTGQVRPRVEATFAKDVALAGYLASLGAPVVPPSAELPSGPHCRNGHVITFWTHVTHDPAHVYQPADVATLLAELHTALRGFPGELPDAPLIDVADMIAYLTRTAPDLVDDTDIRALHAADAKITTALRADDQPSVPLHGDAHPGNLLSTPEGPLWTDFEDAWHGPIGWDLACMNYTSLLDGAKAVAAYPSAPTDTVIVYTARRLQMTVWQLACAARWPARRDRARTALRVWRAEQD
jgi:hypothetical protein